MATSDTFKEIDSKPKQEILKKVVKNKSCTSPKMANEDLSENFKYGCFCGKDYPRADNNRTQDFRKMNKEERTKVIESYLPIEPYDDIDAICKQHDICYLIHGRVVRDCNEAIYDDLHALADKFKANKELSNNKQCRHLAKDIASVFRTVFTIADDEDSFFDYGRLMFNTSITLANKTMEESLDTIIKQRKRYPDDYEKCLTDNVTKP